MNLIRIIICLVLIFLYPSCYNGNTYSLFSEEDENYRLENIYNFKGLENKEDQIFLEFSQISNRQYYNLFVYIRSGNSIDKFYIDSLIFDFCGKQWKENINREFELIPAVEE